MSENGMMKFSAVEAKNASPKTLREFIKDVLRAEDDACANSILPFLTPPGRHGSREYDHAHAVELLLLADANHKGRIATAMERSAISRRLLWDHLVAVYRQVGFRFKHGRLVGLITDMSEGVDERVEGVDDGIE